MGIYDNRVTHHAMSSACHSFVPKLDISILMLFCGVYAWCYFSLSKGVPIVQMLYWEYLSLASSVCIDREQEEECVEV